MRVAWVVAIAALSNCATGHVVERASRARQVPSKAAFADPDQRVRAAAIEGCAHRPTPDCERRILDELAKTEDAIVGRHVNAFIKLRCNRAFADDVRNRLTPSTLVSLRRHISQCPSPDLLAALYLGVAGEQGRAAGLDLFRRSTDAQGGETPASEAVSFLTWALTFKGPSLEARAGLARARDTLGEAQRLREQLAREESRRIAREALFRSGCSHRELSVEHQAVLSSSELGECWRDQAREELKKDELELAKSSLFQAKAQGIDTESLDSELKERIAAVEEEARKKREWEAKWGEFALWRKRSANKAVVQLAVRLAQLRVRAERLRELHAKEVQKNDEATREDDVIIVPLFPEISGSFMFVKILSQYEGEALFRASDGPFVLRLSPGDSFNAYPGQNVYMTIHSRGERMLMTTGSRLPVFQSGAAPSQTRFVKGFKPNRAKEKGLLQRAEAEERAAQALVRSSTVAIDEESGSLKAARESRLEWDTDGDLRLLIRDGDDTVYCIEVGLSCGGVSGERVSSEQLTGEKT